MRTHVISAPHPQQAVDELHACLQPGTRPQLLFTFFGEAADDQGLHRALAERWPGLPCLGGSSAGGLMTQNGLHTGASIGLMAIEDPAGDYGVAAGPLGEDAADSAAALLLEALRRAACAGELPALIWIYQAPGREEAVLRGLRRIVGERCPIVGGSAADEALTGAWRQLGPEGVLHEGLAVAVLFPSTLLRCAFQSGYEPAGPSGLVTEVAASAGSSDGAGREILSIDGRPAAWVYNEWLHGGIADHLQRGGPILADSTLWPLATEVGQVHGLSQFRLVHPASVSATGSLHTFCDLRPGERLYAMRGERQRLIERAERVAQQAHSELPPGSSAAGALIVYCGGCRMAVGERIAEVAQSLRRRLGDTPFIGCFTYGEQGRVMDSNLHGNLMVSAVLLGNGGPQ